LGDRSRALIAEDVSGTAAGALILADAMENRAAGLCTTGVIPSAAVLAELCCWAGNTCDVLAGRVVRADESGLEDPLGVSRTALEAAVSGALSTLSVAVLVLRSRPWKALGGKT
jgi:hypothetical protein